MFAENGSPGTRLPVPWVGGGGFARGRQPPRQTRWADPGLSALAATGRWIRLQM